MKWNWESADWPRFTFDSARLGPLEAQLWRNSGLMLGTLRHLDLSDQDELAIQMMSLEALQSAASEGVKLDRARLQQAIGFQWGQTAKQPKIPPAEQGMAEWITHLYQSYQEPLRHKTLFAWHAMLSKGQRDLTEAGRYRSRDESAANFPGQSGSKKRLATVPPAQQVRSEMKSFIGWFNRTGPQGREELSPLARAGIAHLYFASIHPFASGNGILARALAQKALAQALGYPPLLALAAVIAKSKKRYDGALKKGLKSARMTEWLLFFSRLLLESQSFTQLQIDFLIAKSKLLGRLQGQLNARQEAVLNAIFQGGPEALPEGLSAEKYLAITQTSRATATRDLAGLIALGALTKKGSLRHTRYFLKLVESERAGL